ncbi:MAG: magnesium transporter CorA family protein [Propionibacteriales bacterium]|nr:magnesium transporter CorA family protein [Propionibacteriales bacterium]
MPLRKRGLVHAVRVNNCHSLAWRDGVEVARDFPLAELDQWLARPEVLVWLDLGDPDPSVLAELAAELQFDPLAVEDAVAPMERPKATRHAGHTFLTCYATAVSPAEQGGVTLGLGRVSAFILPRALITVRSGDPVDFAPIVRRWSEDGLLTHGVAALVHGMLDEIVDGHFATITTLDEEIDSLEDLLFDTRRKPAEVQQRVFSLRKALVQLRRVVLPMREVVTAVMRFRDDRATALSSELDGNFNDLYDHVIRAAEWTESLRDMVSSIFETNLSLQDSRLNEIMKKLAGWAAIIAVPTAVTGWFGQNIPYPGFGDPFGLVMSVITILVGSVGLYLVFRKFDWI